MNWSKLYWALVGATALAYGFLVLVAGTELTRLTGQKIPFDFALRGDPFEFALGYLSNLPDAATAHYANVVKPIDTVFPVLFGIVLVWPVLARLTSGRKALAIFAVAYVAFDLAENAAILQMFEAGTGLSEELAQYARVMTILKFVTFLTALYPLWLAVRAKPTRKRGRRK